MRVDTRVADLLGDSNICENRFKINGVFRALRGERKVKILLRSCCCPPGPPPEDAAKRGS